MNTHKHTHVNFCGLARVFSTYKDRPVGGGITGHTSRHIYEENSFWFVLCLKEAPNVSFKHFDDMLTLVVV